MALDDARHPDAERLAEYADGVLASDLRPDVETHLAECADCRAVVVETMAFALAEGHGAAATTTATAAAPGARVVPFRSRRWVAGVAGGLAAAAALLLAVRVGGILGPRDARPELRELVAAASTEPTRPVEGRLTGGFKYAPPPSPTRGPGDREMSPDVRIAAAQIEKLAREKDTPENRAALGIAYLTTGDPDKAVEALEEAVAQRSDNDQYQTDLAAAYLARAGRQNRADDLPKALAAAERAIAINPARLEAWFNRALALERLQVTDGARKAWSDYLERDRDLQWADEARRHLSDIPRRQASWSKPVALPVLDAAMSPGDPAILDRVRQSREPLRERIEDDLLPAWGQAWLDGDYAESDRKLHEAVNAAALLRQAGGDLMPDAGARVVSATVRAARRRDIDALARAHVLYGKTRQLFLADRHAEVGRAFADAARLFRAAGSPYACWGPVFDAISERNLGRNDAAMQALADPSLEACRPYRYVAGRARWMRGLIHATRGEVDAGLLNYLDAAGDFEAGGEIEASVAMETLVAEACYFLGRYSEAWAHEIAALARVDAVATSSRRHLVVITASFLALREDLPEVALHLQDSLVALDRAGGNRAGLPETYLLRARVHGLLRRPVESAADLQLAETALGDVADEGLQRRYRADIDGTRAELAQTSKPEEAAAAATVALEYFKRARYAFRAVTLHVTRARARLAAGRPDAAEQDLRDGIGEFERQRDSLTSQQSRVTSFEAGWTAFEAMVRFQAVDRHRPDVAIVFAERARGRALMEGLTSTRSVPVDPLVARDRLPAGVVVVYCATLEDRLLVWAISRRQVVFAEQRVDRAVLAWNVRSFRSALARPEMSDALPAISRRLYDLVLTPAAPLLAPGTTIVIVADGALLAVPFSALVQPSGRFLVQDYPVILSPSLTFFLDASDRASNYRDRPRSAFVFAPAGVEGNDAGVAALPDAEREAAAIAAFYPDATLVGGRQATKDRFLADAGRFDVVHFAGHGLANLRFPLLSRLLVFPASGAGDMDSVTADDIGERRFTRTSVVVLGSCEGAGGSRVKGEGVLNLARPFLAAGVPIVIASFSTLEDRSARELFIRLHREMSAGLDPASALRRAQLQMLGASQPGFRAPSAWGLVSTFGGMLRHASS
jgi:CHAT domain-containing protein